MTELILERQSLEQEVKPSAIVQYAEALEIRTVDDTLAAQEQLKEIKRRQKVVEDRLNPLREQTHKAWKGVCDLISELVNPLKLAESTIKRKCVAFDDAERRRREEEARKAEVERQERERKERERLEAQAKKAEEKGQVEKAESLREKAEVVTVAPKFTPPAMPTMTKGATIRKTWAGECTSVIELCKAIAEGKASPSLVNPNETAINAHAKAHKDGWSIPGLRFFEKSDMSVRASA